MEEQEVKTYHHKNLKNTLIEKGIVMVNDVGVKELSLRKLAAACGVSHNAPYSHFSNKEQLLSAMQEYITEQFSNCLEEIYVQHRGKKEVMLYLGQGYVEFFIDHPAYFSFLFTKSEIKIDLTSITEQKYNYKPYEIYKRVVSELLSPHTLSAEQKKDILVAMWTFVHGIAAVATMNNVIYDEDWRMKIAEYLRMFHF